MQYRIEEGSSGLGDAFLGKAKDMFHQEAFEQISRPESKLRTYSMIKTVIGKEGYLDQIRNTKYRQKLTKLRLSNHQLMIEKGRHMKLEKRQTHMSRVQRGGRR